jgi:hypothetical protein
MTAEELGPFIRDDGYLPYTVYRMTRRIVLRSLASRGAGWSRVTGYKLIVFLAVASISVTLAGRVFHESGSNVPTARSKAANVKIQHRDRIAQHWSSPLTTVRLPSLPEFAARIPAKVENLPGTRTDSCVYNRPPPHA